MGLPPVRGSLGAGFDGGGTRSLPQLPTGTLLTAQITAKLDANLLKILTPFGSITVQADADALPQLPTGGQLHLAVAGHDKGALQFHLLPEGGKPADGQLPLLREVPARPGGAVPQQTPQQTGQQAPLKAGQQGVPSSLGQPSPPVLRAGQPLTGQLVTASLPNGQQGQQILTPLGAIRPTVPLAFPAGTQLAITLQPDGQTVRLTPVVVQGGQAQGAANPYQAMAGAGKAMVAGKAVDIPVSQLLAVPPQTSAGGEKTALDAAKAAALASQGSAAPMFANFAALAASGKAPLPPDLAALAARVLGLKLDASNGVSANALKTAIRDSGLFHEANLAKGLPQAAGNDLKSLLLKLTEGLKPLLPKEQGGQAQKSDGLDRPLPPQKGMMFEAGNNQSARILAGNSDLPELAKQVEAALSRLKLVQLANAAEKPDGPQDGSRPEAMRRELQVEVPLHYQARVSMMQLHISEERHKQPEGEEGDPRSWRVHFSMQLGGQGAVNAQVNLSGGKFRVFLWAEDAELRAEVRGNLERLRVSLSELGLNLAEVECRKFQLPQKGKTLPGQLMNEVS